MEIDSDYERYYQLHLCKRCVRDQPQSYALLTKTECRQDYLLTESVSLLKLTE